MDEDKDWSSLSSMGGRARAAKLGPARREEIATRAAEVKWRDLRSGGYLLKQPPEVRLCVSLRLSGAMSSKLAAASLAEGLSLSRIMTLAVEAWLARRTAGKGEP